MGNCRPNDPKGWPLVADSDGEGGRGRRQGRGSFWCRSSVEATRGDQDHRREQRRDLDSEPGESQVSLLSNNLQNKTSFWQKWKKQASLLTSHAPLFEGSQQESERVSLWMFPQHFPGSMLPHQIGDGTRHVL